MVSELVGAPRFLARADLGLLLDTLHEDGRRIIGPTLADGAIVYDDVRSVDDLPAGWRATGRPGHYRLERTVGERMFDHAVSPTTWKRWTFPPRVPATTIARHGDDITFTDAVPDVEPVAFLGVRACEIAAMLVQDRVFLHGPAIDRDYAARRAAALVIAVECATPAETCFCTSMGTGPEVTSGFDVAMTELEDGFVVRAGSDAGNELLARLDLGPASPGAVEAAQAVVATARDRIGDPVPTDGLAARLVAAPDSPRWAEVADRCLACANCTLVCPTCFCSSVTQVSDLDGIESVAERTWDSCFTLGFARVAGGNFRPRVEDRYRQWLTHKFGTWWDQFGTSGCVGCGRCITWCPVGIDVREELAIIAPAPASPSRIDRTLTAAGVSAATLPIATAPTVTIEAAGQTYSPTEVIGVRQDTADVATIQLRTDDPLLLAGRPGQFVMVAAPAVSVPPISVSRFLPDGLELTIRAAGAATRKLCAARPGDTLGLRGPLGRGWPIEAARGKDVIVVTGGIGLAPLRPLIDAILHDRDDFRGLRLFYGARTPTDRLFVGELDALSARDDVEVAMTVDRAGPEWLGRVGVVTTLFDRIDCDCPDTVAFVCGPERMMEATRGILRERQIPDENIFVTLERHMECGVGLCGHCQLGRFFVCRDGPVFSVAELGDVFGREGI